MNNKDKTLTEEVTQSLLNIIKKGKPGDMFPPEMELAKKYRVCRNTIREAIRTLVEEGYLYREQGRGTFLTKQKIPFDATTKMDVDATIIDCGYNPASKFINIYGIYADEVDFLCKKLSLNPDDGVWVCEFIRFVDCVPIIFTTSYLPMKNFENLDKHIKQNMPLYEILDYVYKIGEIKKEYYTLECSIPQKKDMSLLKIPKSIPLFILKSRSITSNGIIVDYRISKSRSDLIKFKFK